jgi:hypothetical protein
MVFIKPTEGSHSPFFHNKDVIPLKVSAKIQTKLGAELVYREDIAGHEGSGLG